MFSSSAMANLYLTSLYAGFGSMSILVSIVSIENVTEGDLTTDELVRRSVDGEFVIDVCLPVFVSLVD